MLLPALAEQAGEFAVAQVAAGGPAQPVRLDGFDDIGEVRLAEMFLDLLLAAELEGFGKVEAEEPRRWMPRLWSPPTWLAPDVMPPWIARICCRRPPPAPK